MLGQCLFRKQMSWRQVVTIGDEYGYVYDKEGIKVKLDFLMDLWVKHRSPPELCR